MTILLFSYQVTVHRQGRPVIRVEKGTTLGVLKLLYEAESGIHGSKVLGIRPKSHEMIPCIVTLDESKLTEPVYDLLILGEFSSDARFIVLEFITVRKGRHQQW